MGGAQRFPFGFFAVAMTCLPRVEFCLFFHQNSEKIKEALIKPKQVIANEVKQSRIIDLSASYKLAKRHVLSHFVRSPHNDRINQHLPKNYLGAFKAISRAWGKKSKRSATLVAGVGLASTPK